jgi:hypothetical protein
MSAYAPLRVRPCPLFLGSSGRGPARFAPCNTVRARYGLQDARSLPRARGERIADRARNRRSPCPRAARAPQAGADGGGPAARRASEHQRRGGRHVPALDGRAQRCAPGAEPGGGGAPASRRRIVCRIAASWLPSDLFTPEGGWHHPFSLLRDPAPRFLTRRCRGTPGRAPHRRQVPAGDAGDAEAGAQVPAPRQPAAHALAAAAGAAGGAFSTARGL